MLHNIKTIPLHRVFHGIRFKVNEDWESGKIPSFFARTWRGNFFAYDGVESYSRWGNFLRSIRPHCIYVAVRSCSQIFRSCDLLL